MFDMDHSNPVADGVSQVAALLARQLRKQSGPVLLTGCSGGEGTSTVVRALAGILVCQHGLRTLVVELERPDTLFTPLKLPVTRAAAPSALATPIAVAGGASLVRATLHGNNGHARDAVRKPLARVLHEDAPHFEAVVIDAPPLLIGSRGLEAAAAVGRAILIVEAGRTRVQAIERVKRELAQQEIKLLGAVLNKQRRIIPNWIYRRITT
jgi:hypothetical protein